MWKIYYYDILLKAQTVYASMRLNKTTIHALKVIVEQILIFNI